MTADDEAVINKSTFTPKDAKDSIVGDKSVLKAQDASLSFSKIILWVFSLLLFATGIFIAVSMLYTLVGVVAGILLMVIAVSLPFVVRGDWIKRSLE